MSLKAFHIQAYTKWPPLYRHQFLKCIFLNVEWNCIAMCSCRSSRRKGIIGSRNGLVSNNNNTINVWLTFMPEPLLDHFPDVYMHLEALVFRAPFQYPIRHLIVRSCEVSKPRDCYLSYLIVLTFDRRLGSTAAEVPDKFQSNRTILNTNLAASRLHEILL